LLKKGYEIKKQILNYEGKVIGLLASDQNDLEGFIPCYPSSLTLLSREDKNKLYNFVYMDDNSWYKTYDDTLTFLIGYYEINENDLEKISCKNKNGFCRVIDDNVVIGFLTNTNQFIPIKNPFAKNLLNDDDIENIEYGNSYEADLNTLIDTNDTERAKFIKDIELETNYYNVFRNVIRILLNDYKNINKRKELFNLCNDKNVPYFDKLKMVSEILKKITYEYVVFLSKEDGYDTNKVDQNKLKNCIKDDNEKCSKNSNLCAIINGKCGLIIPKNNLVTEKDNQQIYFNKMADELIRYNRISSFIFKPNSYLSFVKIKYKINPDEIILLEEMIKDYYNEISEAKINNYFKKNTYYLKGNTYDTANPIISQKYPNLEILNDVINPVYNKDYEISEPQNIFNRYPRQLFPKNYKEITYFGNNEVMFHLVNDLLKEYYGKKLDINELKILLHGEYLKYTNNGRDVNKKRQINSILNEEGQIDNNQLQDETMTYEELIMNSGFTPTNFDLWILLNLLEIPSIFISIKYIAETRYEDKIFLSYPAINNKISAIIIPASFKRQRGKYPSYKLILNDNLNSKIDVTTQKINNLYNDALNKKITINDYLNKIFLKDNKTKYKKRKPGKRGLDEIIQKNIEIPIMTKFKKTKPLISYKKGQKEEIDEIFNIEEKPESSTTHIYKKRQIRYIDTDTDDETKDYEMLENANLDENTNETKNDDKNINEDRDEDDFIYKKKKVRYIDSVSDDNNNATDVNNINDTNVNVINNNENNENNENYNGDDDLIIKKIKKIKIISNSDDEKPYQSTKKIIIKKNNNTTRKNKK